jgi:hypothetical protein
VFHFLPFEGVPASLLPRAENRERGQQEARWPIPTDCRRPCPENPSIARNSQKLMLAAAIAEGQPIRKRLKARAGSFPTDVVDPSI